MAVWHPATLHPTPPRRRGLSHEQPNRTKHFPAGGGVGAFLGVGLLVIAMLVIIVGLIVMVL